MASTKKDKKERVSVRAFEKAAKDTIANETTVVWNGIEIVVKKTITFQDTLNFVTSVVESCFDVKTDRYLPEAKLFMIRMFAIDYFTNIALPKNLEDSHKLLYGTNIFETVLENINKAQFTEICDAIDSKIEYLVNSRIAEVEKQLVGLSNAIEEISAKTTDIFSGVTTDDLQKLIGAVINGKLDEERLMSAYFANKEAYDAEDVTIKDDQ